MMDGWSELGAALGGGAPVNGMNRRQAAFQSGADSGMRQASLLEEARRKRDINMGMDSVTPDLVQRAQNGDPEAGASLMSALTHGGVDPRQLTGAWLDQSQLGGLNDIGTALQGVGYTAPEASLGSAFARANRGANIENDMQGMLRSAIPMAGTTAVPQQEASLLHGMGLDTTKIDGGVAYSPFGATDQQINVLPTGAANIAAKNAAAASSYASAARSRAGIGADKAGNYETIDTGSGLIRHNKLTNATTPIMGPDGKPVIKVHPGALPSVTEIGAILGKVRDGDTGQAVVDPQDVQQVYGYFADHPGANIANYVTHAGVGLPGALPPAGSMNLGTLTAPPPDMQAPALAVPAAQANLKQPAAKPATPADPVRPASKAEFDALPSGTPFINPADGRLLRKK